MTVETIDLHNTIRGPSLTTPTHDESAFCLEGLNPEQCRAVTTSEGPVLVLSGAGTGKTRVLTTRLARILALRLAAPWHIMAVTFTNRAAREMKSRVADLVGPDVDRVWIGTFHSLCLRILRRHADVVGLRDGFTILDTDDQHRLLKALMTEAGLDFKKWPVPSVMAVIQRWKDRGWTPKMVPGSEASVCADGRGLDLYRAYQRRLMEVNACDFGDLLLHVLELFRADDDILHTYQQQFRYILVDEYQDTNSAQYQWLHKLAQGHHNICCVGDDDQAIYSWRGADVANILRFEADFPGATVVRLERNYRSTPMILAAAAAVIRCNEGRLGKDLYAAAAQGQGDKITVTNVWDGAAEAQKVVGQVEDLRHRGHSLSQMAILVRAGFQTREFEDRMIVTGTPYRIVGGLRFYERLEIRDIMAYLRLVTQPSDDLAFERIINTPKRGLGSASLQVLHAVARNQSTPLLAAARVVMDSDELKPKARKAVSDFITQVDRWTTLAIQLSPAELSSIVLDESGYLESWKNDKTPEAPGRVENLQEFVRSLEGYDSVAEFLEHVALVVDNDRKADQDDVITLMTLHAAKGLEFDTIFLPGWEEDVFPIRRALDEAGEKGLEEERRLAYVALTRARHRVFISHASQRRIFRDWAPCIPSRFIEEIPAECREMCVEYNYDQRHTSWYRSQPKTEQDHSRKEAISSTITTSRPYKKGMRVFHQKFGPGTVVSMESDRLEVAFDHAGLKRVLANFIERIPPKQG